MSLWLPFTLPFERVCLPLLASDAQPFHGAHHGHRTPHLTAAWRRNAAVGQFLRDVAIWHLPHLSSRAAAASVFILPTLGLPRTTPRSSRPKRIFRALADHRALFLRKGGMDVQHEGVTLRPSCVTMNGTRLLMRPEMKCTSRDSRSSLDTTMWAPSCLALRSFNR